METAQSRRWLAVAIAAMLAIAVAACGGGGSDDVGIANTPTTVAAAAPGPSTSTTFAPPPAGTIPFISIPPTTGDGVSPEGSGCTPPSATRLADGRWFGVLTEVDPVAGTIGLDLACLFFFDAANAAATADGAAEVPVPNDYWIRNQSPNVYTVPVIDDVAVGIVTTELVGGVTFEPTKTGVAAAAPLIDRYGVWIDVVDGWVVAIQQQYFP